MEKFSLYRPINGQDLSLNRQTMIMNELIRYLL